MLGVNKGETSIKRAALINMASRYASAFLQLVYSIILARILSPSDFGIVAIAQVFVTFFSLFSDMGLGSAIVQRQDLGHDDVRRLFGFSLLLGALLASLFALTGIPMSSAYGEPELVGICASLSVTVFFSTLNTVPNALLMKQKRFVAVGGRQVVCAVVASCLGLVSASLGIGPYAIVVYSISSAVLTFSWNWLSNRVAPLLRGSLKSVRKVASYSAYLFGFNLVTYFTRNADNLLIGYFFGSAVLGNYGKAYQLMQYPQTYLTSVVTSVLHPMLAERQDDREHIYGVFIKLTKMLSLIGLPIGIMCYFYADGIVDLLYGSQWGQAATCLKYLSISIWCQMVCGTSGSMFQVLNRTREQFVRGILIAIAVVGSILVGVYLGKVEYVALGVGISYWVAFLLMLPFLIRRSFGKKSLPFLKTFLPELGMAACLVAALMLADRALAGTAFHMPVGMLVCVVLYVALLLATGQIRWLAPILPGRLRRALGARGKAKTEEPAGK